MLQNKLFRYILAVLSLSALLIPLFFYFMGGFEKPNYCILNKGREFVVGREFSGQIGSQQFNTFFADLGKDLEKAGIKGHSFMHYDCVPERADEQQVCKVILGMIVNDSTSTELMETLQLKVFPFPAQNVARVSWKSVSVAPRPHKVVELLEAFAKEKQVNLAQQLFEYYYLEDSVATCMPIIN